MANSSPVYDPETESGSEPTYQAPPDLGPGHSRAAGDASDPRGDLRQAEDKKPDAGTGTGAGGGENAGSDKSGDTGGGDGGKAVDKSGLAAAESGSADSGGGGGMFKDTDDSGGRLNRFVRSAKKNRKKALLGGGTGAGIVGLLVAGFLMLIPLKIEHIVDNLQNKFFGTSNSAVEEETQNLFKNYIEQKVLPAYKSCGTTRSKDCTPKNFGDGPVGNLYKTWSNARLENKLADDYGIEFKFDTTSNSWKLKTSSNSTGIDIGADGGGLDQEFNSRGAARSAITASLDDALQNETKWKSVMVRFKTGRLLEEKYGVKRCVLWCGKQDQLADSIAKQQKAAQLYIVQRVVAPLSESRAAILECMINACDPTKTDPQTADDGTSSEEAGEPQSQLEEDLQTQAQQTAAGFASESADQLSAKVDAIREKGWSAYLLESALDKVGLSAISSQAADAVPVVGAISTASGIITFASNAGPALQKLSYVANSGGAASLFMLFRTYADEIHTGHVNATEVGSMVDSLGNGPQNTTATDPEVGGTASAEATPLYQNLIDGNGSGTVNSSLSFVDNLLPGKAYAATTTGDSTTAGDQYKCNNGSPVPAGKLVCPEEVLGQSNGALDSASTFLNSPYISPITSAAGVIHGITGAIGGFIGGIINHFPGVSNLSELVSNVLQPFFKDVINVLVPNPFSDNMSGGRTFDMMAAGADVSGNDNAHMELGGQALTPQQAADINNQQESEAEQQFGQQSFFARMFSTDSQYSLVSKLALAMPLSKQAAVQSSFASLLNPLNTFGHGFSSLLSGKANAAETAQADPFGVTQYGYPAGTIPSDPQTYWDNNCSDNASNAYMKDNSWNEAASNTLDPTNGMPENTTTNPCLLIMGTVGSAGGLFDTSNLTKDDLADLNGSGGSTGSAGTGSTTTGSTGISGSGSGKFTTDTTHAPYPGLQQMLATVQKVNSDPSAAASFCASLEGGTCLARCMAAVGMAWIGTASGYYYPFGSAGNTPVAGSAWAAALESGHAHPGDRNPPVGALLIYNYHNPADTAGHVTIYLGNNLVFSTDFDHPSSAGIDPASDIETGAWANSYVGWMDPYFYGKVGN
jgi:hypothetical protein